MFSQKTFGDGWCSSKLQSRRERYQGAQKACFSNHWAEEPPNHGYKYLKEREATENVFQPELKHDVFGPSTLHHQLLTTNATHFNFTYVRTHFQLRNAVLLDSKKKQLNCILF